MKTVIINGSPKKKGNTEFLIDEFKQNIKGNLIQYNLVDLKYCGCKNCSCCVRFGRCCIKDDMIGVYNDVIDCDVLVIASPIYFAQLTGDILNFMSRAEFIYSHKNNPISTINDIQIKRKSGAIILTCGGSNKNYDGVALSLKDYFNLLNTNYIGSVGSFNTEKVPAREDITAIKEAKNLACLINTINSNK